MLYNKKNSISVFWMLKRFKLLLHTCLIHSNWYENKRICYIKLDQIIIISDQLWSIFEFIFNCIDRFKFYLDNQIVISVCNCMGCSVFRLINCFAPLKLLLSLILPHETILVSVCPLKLSFSSSLVSVHPIFFHSVE